jgi:hypothetical protein
VRHSSVVSSSRCHSSASSLSLSDNSASSQPFEAANLSARSSCLIFGRSQSQNKVPTKSGKSPSACYYGFGGISLNDWDDDNARASNDLSDDDEDAAVKAIVMATADPEHCYAGSDGMSTHGNYNECTGSTESQYHDDSCNRQISDLLELDERAEYNNVYACLSSCARSVDGEISCDRIEELNIKPTETTADSRLFGQLIDSGFLNYGFYSFSLAKFINDHTNLTDYLTLVSSSTGASYYLDLEFKPKSRQPSNLLRASAYTAQRDSNANYIFQLSNSRETIDKGLSLNGSIKFNSDASSLKSNGSRNLSFCSLNNYTKRSISNCSNDSQTQNYQPIQNQQPPSFTNNMIAKLASSNGANSQKASSNQAAATMSSSASQSKRKRSKLLDLLLNTNWSKQSQQAANLMKLNKILLVCDANFLDEKTGESPLSLVITSPQINDTQLSSKATRLRSSGGASLTSSANGCPQSTSLFDLQSQHSTTSHNLLTLHQTSAVEISQSKAPLVERILLLLIKSGALIDFRNSDGRTPLHVAAKASNFWALKTLLDLGK